MPQSLEPETGLTLILGGARSGKSAFAERLAAESGLKKLYLATAQAFDGEMEDRIGHHQARRGDEWALVEEPLALADVLRDRAEADTIILVDCLTLWLTNQLMAERDVEAECDALTATLDELKDRPILLVTNEVGQGIVPVDAMARAFRDYAGRLHQQIAAVARHVWFVTAGLPQKLK